MTDAADEASGQRFGTDVDAALNHWGGYDGFAEGAMLAHRVIDLLAQHLGSLTDCWVPSTAPYAGFRFSRLDSMALTANWGYLFVTNAAVELMRRDGSNPLSTFRDAHLSTEETWNDGLSVWTSRGVRDRAPSVLGSKPSGRKCSDQACVGANIVQPSAECDFCGQPLE